MLSAILVLSPPSYANTTIDFLSSNDTANYGATYTPSGAQAPVQTTIFTTTAGPIPDATFLGTLTSKGLLSAPAGIAVGNSNISPNGNATFAGSVAGSTLAATGAVSGASLAASGSVAGATVTTTSNITDGGLAHCAVGSMVTVGQGGVLTCAAAPTSTSTSSTTILTQDFIEDYETPFGNYWNMNCAKSSQTCTVNGNPATIVNVTSSTITLSYAYQGDVSGVVTNTFSLDPNQVNYYGNNTTYNPPVSYATEGGVLYVSSQNIVPPSTTYSKSTADIKSVKVTSNIPTPF